MSTHSSKSSESDIKSIKTLLKQLAKEFQSFSYRQLEHEVQIKELKMAKEKDESSQKSKKICSHASSSHNHEFFGKESLRINEYYQPPPRRTRRERKEQQSPREVREIYLIFMEKKM